jgi:hypothetical protein
MVRSAFNGVASSGDEVVVAAATNLDGRQQPTPCLPSRQEQMQSEIWPWMSWWWRSPSFFLVKCKRQRIGRLEVEGWRRKDLESCRKRKKEEQGAVAAWKRGPQLRRERR